MFVLFPPRFFFVCYMLGPRWAIRETLNTSPLCRARCLRENLRIIVGSVDAMP